MAKHKSGGRKIGIPNKTTSQIKHVLVSVLSKEINKLPHYLEELNTKTRIEVIIKLLPYVAPKEIQVIHDTIPFPQIIIPDNPYSEEN